MIREKLQAIGLTAGESEMYELLVENGQTKAGALIKKASLASSKVYDVLQKLVSKGLASTVTRNGVRLYQATPPERLVDFLDNKKSEIDAAKEEMLKIIPLIKQKRKEEKRESDIRMYLGKEGPKIVLRELVEASIKEKYNYGYGTKDNPFAEQYPHELGQFFIDEKKYGLKTMILFAEGHRQKQPMAQIRYLPPEFITPVRTMIGGNKVFLVDFTKPITSIIIENEQIAKSYRDHFMFLWKMAKE